MDIYRYRYMHRHRQHGNADGDYRPNTSPYKASRKEFIVSQLTVNTYFIRTYAVSHHHCNDSPHLISFKTTLMRFNSFAIIVSERSRDNFLVFGKFFLIPKPLKFAQLSLM